jgi:hypothetical protein
MTNLRAPHDTLLLTTEGPLMRIYESDEIEGPFHKLLDELGYWYEMENHYTFSLYPVDDVRREDFLSLYRWQFVGVSSTIPLSPFTRGDQWHGVSIMGDQAEPSTFLENSRNAEMPRLAVSIE